jgi:hypothetical protein
MPCLARVTAAAKAILTCCAARSVASICSGIDPPEEFWEIQDAPLPAGEQAAGSA